MNLLTALMTGATSGPPIPVYEAPSTAVLVLDLQRDFLAADARMPIARNQVDGVLAASNAVIGAAAESGAKVVYVANQFSPSDVVANLFRRSAALRGSRGAALDPRVLEVEGEHFPKSARDAFTNPDLDAYLRRERVSRLVVLGVFADACVRGTILGALNRGYAVTVVREGVGASSDSSCASALAAYAKAGATVAAVDDVVLSLRADRSAASPTTPLVATR